METLVWKGALVDPNAMRSAQFTKVKLLVDHRLEKRQVFLHVGGVARDFNSTGPDTPDGPLTALRLPS
jgi:hypothetical protein